MFRLPIAAAVVAALALAIGSASAQKIPQIELTEKQVLGFIAAQRDIEAVAEKIREGDAAQPDPKIRAELEAIVVKHGFAGFSDYDLVTVNIAMIMGGIDPLTKAFTEPQDVLKKEIAEVEADKSIPAKEKQQMLEELNEALRETQPVQHKGNIELVKKHFEQLEALQ